MKAMEFTWPNLLGFQRLFYGRADKILKSLEKDGQKVVVNEKEDKKQVAGQVDFFNFKLDEIARELDKVNLNELTPIDALNTLVKMKEKMK